MKRKDFRLQKVLEIQELLEKQQQRDLAVFKQKLKAFEAELVKIQARKNSLTLNLLDIDQVPVARMLNYYDYLSALSEKIMAQHSTIGELRIEMEQQRQKLLQATKDKKMLETLKERFVAGLRFEQHKNEQILMEEIAARKNFSFLT
ncbi:MAG: flagellar export protein FliJ [bacterium]